MSAPKVTVTLGSNRPGGIDIALAGLARQTFKDFEVVFVDGRYHKRHTEVLEAVKYYALEQPFYHVPNHRYSGTIWGNPCAGYNTGFALAAGEIVVMLLDYAYAPPNWLSHHVAHAGKIAMGPHEYRTLSGWETLYEDDQDKVKNYHARQNVDGREPDEVIKEILKQYEMFEEGSIFEAAFCPEDLEHFPREESDAKCDIATGPLNYTYFNTKNESFPLETVLAINGMDENYDRGRGPGDPDLGLRLARQSKAETWCVQEAIVHCINPRQILPNLNIVIPEGARLPDPWADRWYIQDGYDYFEKVKSNPGLVRAANPFDIRKLREDIWHWRQDSLREEAILPKIIIPDSEYY